MGPIKDAFLPSPANGHHPHLLRTQAITVALSLLVFIEALALAQGYFGIKAGDYAASVLSGAITTYTNDARVGEGLGALTPNPRLATAASAKARDMALKGYFAHTSPDGTLPWKWIGDTGYSYQYAGENLAVDFTDSKDVVTAWLNSPAHRDNLLGANFTEIGVGIATGTYKGKEAVFVVQYFGRPTPVAVVSPTPSQPASAPIVATAPSAGTVLGEAVAAVPNAAVAAPHTTSNYVFMAVAAFFALLLLLALAFKFRLPKGSASIAGLGVAACALLFMLLNTQAFGETTLPLDDQNASVYNALIQPEAEPVATSTSKG